MRTRVHREKHAQIKGLDRMYDPAEQEHGLATEVWLAPEVWNEESK